MVEIPQPLRLIIHLLNQHKNHNNGICPHCCGRNKLEKIFVQQFYYAAFVLNNWMRAGFVRVCMMPKHRSLPWQTETVKQQNSWMQLEHRQRYAWRSFVSIYAVISLIFCLCTFENFYYFCAAAGTDINDFKSILKLLFQVPNEWDFWLAWWDQMYTIIQQFSCLDVLWIRII